MKELTTLRDMLAKARCERYAVGGFNFCNAETAQVIFSQAVRLRSPAMLIAAALLAAGGGTPLIYASDPKDIRAIGGDAVATVALT